MAEGAIPVPVLRLCPVSAVTPRAVAWLWPGRLALGKPALLEGDPGLGKSLLTLDLCARLSTGAPFPDGSGGGERANSIILNGEDNDADTIRPRLQALGANLERVYVPERVEHCEPLLYLPDHTDRLERALAARQARLLVIDPLVAFLERQVNINDDASIRRALYRLALIADKHACAMLLVRHLNKRAGQRSIYRGGGSIGLLGASRSGWLVARDPEVPERRVLAEVKNNLGPAQPSLAFLVAPAEEGGQPLLSWLGACAWTAEALLDNKSATVAPREQAKDFLRAVLQEGPRTSRDVWNLAEKEGFTKRTLRRAKMDLRVRSEIVYADRRRLSYWLLPKQELPESIKPPPREGDTVGPWLEWLNATYPSATPIDDL
jgi:putative DNA primase/helicase